MRKPAVREPETTEGREGHPPGAGEATGLRQARASAWFEQLRDRIVAAFESLEDELAEGPFAALPAGRFEVRRTRRNATADEPAHWPSPPDSAPEGVAGFNAGGGTRVCTRAQAADPASGVARGAGSGGGGIMSVMRGGRVFEKVGVNVSTVHGMLGPQAQAAMTARGVPGMEGDPRFWASGISLVAHMRNPHAPAVHMNTRMFRTPHAWWFGGGADLNPAIEYAADTAHFHTVLEAACAGHGPGYYARFRDWAERYFFVAHRGRTRGVGGIFYDDLNTGDWEADFAFTRAVGEALLPAFLPLARLRATADVTPEQQDALLRYRGLYAEYNLVYDRGTKFGLESGHDPDAVLMSLPPMASWR